MDLTLRYRQYLEEQKLSPLSVKNYLADLNKFLAWLNKRSDLAATQGRTLNNWNSDFQAYYQYLIKNQVSQASLPRYLSSLRQFGRFLAASGETAENPAAQLAPMISEADKLLTGFEKSMVKEKLSASTIRNYVVDVRQFLSWYMIRNES